jgi:hypothetical protein
VEKKDIWHVIAKKIKMALIRKLNYPTVIGTMWLDISTSTTSPILSLAPVSSFFFSTQINYNNFIISTHALLDSGASTNFIDKKIVNPHSIPLILKKTLVNMEVIDG